MYDIIIVGGGPAGLTAAIYAQRAGKTCAVFEKDITGGMINNSAKVENIPGFLNISGPTFADQLTAQAEDYGAEIIYEEVTKIATVLHAYHCNYHIFQVMADDKSYMCKSVIIATGTKHNVLHLDNEDELIGNGIHFCALCDGAFYKDKDVIVIGGGNSAMTEALYLSNICNKVTILQDLPQLTGDSILISKIADTENINVITNCNIREYSLLEDGSLNGILYSLKNTSEEDTKFILCDGIFLCIGLSPMPDLTSNLLEYSKSGYIIKSRTNGLFFAGDCSYNSEVKQVATACGDGAIAGTNAARYIDSL